MSTFTYDHFLDFHTHSQQHPENKEITEIVSVHLGQDKTAEYFTVGLHPWWTNKPIDDSQKEELISLLSSPNCLAMGEMGLDKLKGPEINIQMNVLRSQLAIASELNKPVVIHCVRAMDQLLKIKKEFSEISRWCIHGFGRKTILARQLIDQGFYLSLMPPKDSSKYQSYFRELPHDRIFLETDSMSGISIQEIYLQVAGETGISIHQLKKQMIQNVETFLKHD